MGVIFNATKLADDVEKNVTVSVFVDIGTKQNEMKTLEKQLKGLDNVEDISYSNKDQLVMALLMEIPTFTSLSVSLRKFTFNSVSSFGASNKSK